MKEWILSIFSLGVSFDNVPTSQTDRILRGFFGVCATLLSAGASVGLAFVLGMAAFDGYYQALVFCLLALLFFLPLTLGSFLYAYRGIKGYERVYIGREGAKEKAELGLPTQELVEREEQRQKVRDEESARRSAEWTNEILRWLFCIPLGLIGGTCIQFIYVYLNRYAEPGSVLYIIETLVAGGLAGAAVVYIAAYVAPSHRAWVAIFISLLSVANLYVGVQIAQADGDWLSVLLNVTQTGGSILLTYYICRNRITFN